MIVGVGSTNRVKLEAVRASLGRLYPDVVVCGVDVNTGVSSQPWGDDEIIRGAITRARFALARVEGAEWGIGIESGIVHNEAGYFTNAWCAICDGDGRVSLGGGFSVELPPQVVRDLEAGLELGQAISKVHAPQEAATVGAIGVLTDKATTRQYAYEAIVLCATTRFRRPDLYAGSKGNG